MADNNNGNISLGQRIMRGWGSFLSGKGSSSSRNTASRLLAKRLYTSDELLKISKDSSKATLVDKWALQKSEEARRVAQGNPGIVDKSMPLPDIEWEGGVFTVMIKNVRHQSDINERIENLKRVRDTYHITLPEDMTAIIEEQSCKDYEGRYYWDNSNGNVLRVAGYDDNGLDRDLVALPDRFTLVLDTYDAMSNIIKTTRGLTIDNLQKEIRENKLSLMEAMAVEDYKRQTSVVKSSGENFGRLAMNMSVNHNTGTLTAEDNVRFHIDGDVVNGRSYEYTASGWNLSEGKDGTPILRLYSNEIRRNGNPVGIDINPYNAYRYERQLGTINDKLFSHVDKLRGIASAIVPTVYGHDKKPNIGESIRIDTKALPHGDGVEFGGKRYYEFTISKYGDVFGRDAGSNGNTSMLDARGRLQLYNFLNVRAYDIIAENTVEPSLGRYESNETAKRLISALGSNFSKEKFIEAVHRHEVNSDDYYSAYPLLNVLLVRDLQADGGVKTLDSSITLYDKGIYQGEFTDVTNRSGRFYIVRKRPHDDVSLPSPFGGGQKPVYDLAPDSRRILCERLLWTDIKETLKGLSLDNWQTQSVSFSPDNRKYAVIDSITRENSVFHDAGNTLKFHGNIVDSEGKVTGKVHPYLADFNGYALDNVLLKVREYAGRETVREEKEREMSERDAIIEENVADFEEKAKEAEPPVREEAIPEPSVEKDVEIGGRIKPRHTVSDLESSSLLRLMSVLGLTFELENKAPGEWNILVKDTRTGEAMASAELDKDDRKALFVENSVSIDKLGCYYFSESIINYQKPEEAKMQEVTPADEQVSQESGLSETERGKQQEGEGENEEKENEEQTYGHQEGEAASETLQGVQQNNEDSVSKSDGVSENVGKQADSTESDRNDVEKEGEQPQEWHDSRNLLFSLLDKIFADEGDTLKLPDDGTGTSLGIIEFRDGNMSDIVSIVKTDDTCIARYMKDDNLTEIPLDNPDISKSTFDRLYEDFSQGKVAFAVESSEEKENEEMEKKWKEAEDASEATEPVKDDLLAQGRWHTGKQLCQEAWRTYSSLLVDRINYQTANENLPWISVRTTIPRNLEGKEYDGINALMLGMQTEKGGFQLPVYLTKDEVESNGLTLTDMAYPFPVIDSDDKVTSVYNIEQTDYPVKQPTRYAEMVEENAGEAEKSNGDAVSLANMVSNGEWVVPSSVDYDIKKSFYNESEHKVHVLPKDKYESSNDYYRELVLPLVASVREFPKDGITITGNISKDLVDNLAVAMVSQRYRFDAYDRDISHFWRERLAHNPDFTSTVLRSAELSSRKVFDRVEQLTEQVDEGPKLDVMSTTGSTVDADGNGIIDDQENLAPARRHEDEDKKKEEIHYVAHHR